MRNVSVSRRYARALIDVATEAGVADRVLEQLTAYVELLEKNRDVAAALINPGFAQTQRSAVVEALIRAGADIHPLVANLLRLLGDRGRFGDLANIARAYRDLADAKAGRVRGKVTSATALSKDHVQKLADALAKVVQRDVVLETQVDPKLLGGVSAQVGSILYDGSLRTQLEDLRRTLRSR